MHGVSRVNYFGLIGSLGVTIAFIYTLVGWKMLPRTADIIHGFCISPGEISSTTRNLLFRPVVVAQICGLFHDASPFSRWNSVSPSLFFSFFHIFFLFLSFLRLVLSVPIVDASWHTFIIHGRWFHRNRGLRAGGKLTIPALPLFVLSPGVVKYPAAGWWDALERELQPSAPVFGKYLNARQREWESCLVARVYRLRSSL